MAKPLDERIDTPTRVLIAVGCGIGMIVVYQIFPGWEQVFLATVVVVGFLLVQFRELWTAPTYWVFFLGALIIHRGLMILLRKVMNDFRFFSTLIIILLEAFVFFVLVRRLVLPKARVDGQVRN